MYFNANLGGLCLCLRDYSSLDKVKSFIDNESFVFTFSKTNAFAIHKDQLFKNQLYKSHIDHNGYEINERK